VCSVQSVYCKGQSSTAAPTGYTGGRDLGWPGHGVVGVTMLAGMFLFLAWSRRRRAA
jgi:hypothetical protein